MLVRTTPSVQTPPQVMLDQLGWLLGYPPDPPELSWATEVEIGTKSHLHRKQEGESGAQRSLQARLKLGKVGRQQASVSRKFLFKQIRR